MTNDLISYVMWIETLTNLGRKEQIGRYLSRKMCHLINLGVHPIFSIFTRQTIVNVGCTSRSEDKPNWVYVLSLTKIEKLLFRVFNEMVDIVTIIEKNNKRSKGQEFFLRFIHNCFIYRGQNNSITIPLIPLIIPLTSPTPLVTPLIPLTR